jgi:hypothetical protein
VLLRPVGSKVKTFRASLVNGKAAPTGEGALAGEEASTGEGGKGGKGGKGGIDIEASLP